LHRRDEPGLRRARADRLLTCLIVTIAASEDMSDKIQLILGGIAAVLFGLSALARRFPHIAWLQHFYFELPKVSEEQKAKMQRRATLHAGLQLILLGIVLPMGYVVLTVMMFNDVTRKAMTIVLTGSVVCIALGITAIVSGFRR
jgi:hypothetical protein